MTQPLSPEDKLRRHLGRQQRRYGEQAHPQTLAMAQSSQAVPRAATIVSDWSPDEHGNPTRTIRARE
jgi:hypothetical protein